MAIDRIAQPFYDSSVSEYHNKNYRQILFTSGRAVQCRELTGIGNFATEHIKEVAGLMYKEGTILNGCTVRAVDRTPRVDYEDALSGLTVGLITLNGGRIFVDGYPFEIEFTKFPAYSKSQIPIRLTGTETIYVEILDTVVTAVEDETLLDPASGYDNYGAPGAHRLQRVARYISTAHKDYNVPGNIRIPIVELYDGKITYEAASKGETNSSSDSVSAETNILDLLSQRTFETSGNYLVNGYKVKQEACPDNTKIGVTVSSGVGYIGGKRIELSSAFTGYIDKVMVTSTVQGEEKAVEYETNDAGNIVYVSGIPQVVRRYKLNSSPVSSVTNVAIPKIAKAQLTYTTASQTYIQNNAGSINKILHCYTPLSPEPGLGNVDKLPDSYKEYIEGVDFRFENQSIVWINGGNNPATTTGSVSGNTFYVIYLFKPNLEAEDYHIEFSSTREATLTLPLTNGVATIPAEFYNPTIKSVLSGKTELVNNKQYYATGNKIYVATESSPTLPVRVIRSSTSNFDNIGVGGAVLKTAKMYSESGVVYYKMDSSMEASPDYRFYSETGNIEWLSSNRPAYGEAYLVEVSMPSGVCINYGSEAERITITFTYENLADIYSNRCHDSYLVIHDDVTLGRSDAGGDNITISYEVAKARTTTVGLDANGAIAFYHGTVIDQNNNLTPTVPTSSLPIADLFIKPTTAEDYVITSMNNYRMRQTELRDMFDRLKDVEYNISLNELETEAETKLAGSVLRGVFTDSFTTVKKMDNSLVWSFIKSTDNQAIPNITQAALGPNFRRCTVDLKVNEANTTAGLFKSDSSNGLYLMSKNYSKELWLEQPFATKIRSAAEGLDAMECFPSFMIDPDNDQFIEYQDQDLIYEEDNSDVKNCYVFNGDSAAMISEEIPALDTGGAGTVTLQFWMYLDTDKDCMPISFKGDQISSSDPYSMGYSVWSTKDYFGFNTYNSDVSGITNEELRGYWRAITLVLVKQADTLKMNELYINGEKQNISAYKTTSSGKFTTNNARFGHQIRLSGSFRTPSSWYFRGKIADVRVWNKKISTQQIKDFSGKELVGNEDGLVAWWKTPLTTEGSRTYVRDSCTNANGGHKLYVEPNGGYASNPDGTITSETRSFAKMLNGSDASTSRGAVIKNVMDLTVGNVPDTSTSLVLDPTVSAKSQTGYVTKNADLVSQVSALGGDIGYYGSANYGGVNASQLKGDIKYNAVSGSNYVKTSNQYDSYNVEQTYYEKVTTQTDQILGDFVTDVSTVSKLRQRVITVQGTGFLADTDLISITFDGVPVNLYKLTDYDAAKHGAPSTAGKSEDRYWKTNSRGEFKCGFIIPKDIQIGVREVKLTAPGGIELKASYWGAGMKASKLTLTQTNEVVKWEPRTQIIGQQYMNSEGWILLDGWNCRSRCGTTPLCQTFYVNDSSLTKPVIKDIATNSDVFLTSVDVYFRTAGECPDCIAGFVELTDSGVPRSDSGAGPSRFVGGVKVFDSKTINVTNGNPSLATAAHNIAWENLVPLEGGKGYGFIVGSTDGETTMWVASLESNENTDVTTQVQVISEPDRGILLSSPNGQTWATYIKEDMKYSFYIANFFSDNKLAIAPSSMRPSQGFSSTGRVSYIEYNEVNVEQESADKLSKMNFFMFEVNAQNSHDGSGFIQYQYATKDETTGLYGAWQPFNNGSMVFLDNAVKTIKIRIAMYSYNPYSSPIVSKDACLTCGQYILPSTYTSITGTPGTWNVAEIYIDKFFDSNKSDVDLYISPDQGFTWKKMTTPIDLTPIAAYSARYNGEPINQYHYQLKLTVDQPEIESISIVNGNPGDFASAQNNEWEFAVALVDAYGNESPVSDSKMITIPSINSNVQMKIKFDPNATGFRVYARPTSESGDPYLFYDSTATAILQENIADSSSLSKITLSEGAARFPKTGTLMIDNEYMAYEMAEGDEYSTVNSSGERIYTANITSRNTTHHGRESVRGAHKAGTEVMMVNQGFLHQDSPTPCVSGVWRFPSYTMDSDFTWHFEFTAKDELYQSRQDVLKKVTPSYDEDLPANYTSENVTFRIEMTDKYGEPNSSGNIVVDTLDRIPQAGRVMITSGYEQF